MLLLNNGLCALEEKNQQQGDKRVVAESMKIADTPKIENIQHPTGSSSVKNSISLPTGPYGLPAGEVSENVNIHATANVSAAFDFDLPQKVLPKGIEKDLKEAIEEELYWDQNKFGSQVGHASLYAGMFHRRRTASGELHNNYAASAAHKKLPFGTEVKVTNLQKGSDYGKTVIVKINDRGPFVKGRIIDLSIEAAKKIGLTISKGITKVKLEVVKSSAAKAGAVSANIVSTANRGVVQ